MQKHDVIIVGTGPSGLTAAIYTARANLNPVVFEGKEPGGQLTLTTEVENFPGFPKGIQGPELMSNMKEQALRFGAKFIPSTITSVDLSSKPFKVVDDKDQVYQAETLIISTGASAKFLGLPNEKELTGRGVSTCATCDGFFYQDRIVHVVGGGDTAMEESLFLTKYASEVTLIHRRDSFRASKVMQDKVLNHPKIKILWDSEVKEILHNEQGVTGIVVKNLKTDDMEKRKTDGLFYGIGHTPNTAFLEGQLDLDSHGLIKTDSLTKTSVEGVFACGDVQDTTFRQAITAAGSGCQSAMMAEKFLES